LQKRQPGAPFCFWYGAAEPHRGYERGSGLKAGKKLEDVVVPGFLLSGSAWYQILLFQGPRVWPISHPFCSVISRHFWAPVSQLIFSG
jgi:hypothetical protein